MSLTQTPPTAQRLPVNVQRDIQTRLEMARAVLAQGGAPLLQDKHHILKTRAAALAQEPAWQVATDAHLDVVEFRLAEERYALELLSIREVYPLRELTPLCCTPPFVLGLLNVRGHILSVIDLRDFFDLPKNEPTRLSRVMIVHTEAMELGILADVVLGVRAVPLHTLQPSLPTLTGVREEYLRGVTPDGLVLLDASKMLSDKRLIVHEEVDP
jgi:purine-binding chemotaxis protein CheW